MENRGLPRMERCFSYVTLPGGWSVARQINSFVSADQRLMRVPAGHVHSIYDS